MSAAAHSDSVPFRGRVLPGQPRVPPSPPRLADTRDANPVVVIAGVDSSIVIQETFLRAFSNAYEQYRGDEGRAFAVAHTAAKRAGQKPGPG